MGLSLRGQSSGAIDINAPNVAGNNTITLPGSNGVANQFYKNSGTAGTLTHSSMIELSNGRIGIGSDNPNAALSVLSAAYPTATITRDHPSNYPRLRITNTSTDGADLDGLGSGGGFRIACVAAGVSTERVRLTSTGCAIISNTGSFSPYVADTNLQVTDDTNPKIVLNNPGNSTYSLSVPSSQNNNLIIRNESQGRDDISIDYVASRVGIGTDDPAYNVEIRGNNAQELLIGSYNALGAGIILDGDSNGDGGGGDYCQIFHHTDGTLNFRSRNGDGGTDIIYYSNATETMRMTAGGNLKFSQSGKGIDFSVTGDTAGATSELLDDYEEGTWTPSVTGLSGLIQASGNYVKIGNLVTVGLFLNIGTKTYAGSGSGSTTLQFPLPFNNSGVSDVYFGASIGNLRYIDFSGNSAEQFCANIGGTNNILYGRWLKNNSNFTDVTLGDLYNTFSIHASVTYRTA